MSLIPMPHKKTQTCQQPSYIHECQITQGMSYLINGKEQVLQMWKN